MDSRITVRCRSCDDTALLVMEDTKDWTRVESAPLWLPEGWRMIPAPEGFKGSPVPVCSEGCGQDILGDQRSYNVEHDGSVRPKTTIGLMTGVPDYYWERE